MGNILIIGLGKLGSSLSRFLIESRNVSVAAVDKTPFDKAWPNFLPQDHYFSVLNNEVVQNANGIFISVPDDQIPTAIDTLSSFELQDKFVVHTSGLVNADVLQPLQKRGALIGSLHPLQTFNKKFLPANVWHSITCTFQGDLRLLTILNGLFAPAKARFVQVNGRQKMAVHLAAVVAANFQIALYAWAQQILSNAGLKNITASQLLGPLALKVAKNFTENPLNEILSGPLQRGDLQTILEHLNFLRQQNDASSIQLYKMLALKLLQNSDFPIEKRDELMRLFND